MCSDYAVTLECRHGGTERLARCLAVLLAVALGVAGWNAGTAQTIIFLDGFETCEFFADADGDGFGDPDIRVDDCPIPAGFVRNDDDCDDTSPSTFPGSASADDPSACMKDVDGDGFGDRSPPVGVAPGSDCDDEDPSVNPDADEACDGLDNDCDGKIDEGNPGGGGSCDTGLLGVCSSGELACESGSLQCNQTTSSGDEVCDGLDNDCDGAVDEGVCNRI